MILCYYVFSNFGMKAFMSESLAYDYYDSICDEPTCDFALVVSSTGYEHELENMSMDIPEWVDILRSALK